MTAFLDLRTHNETLRSEIDAAIARVLDAGRYILGEQVSAFEEEFAGVCGGGHAIGVGNGTDAIELALRAVGVAAGDEVITVANAGAPGVAAIERAGAVPVLVDVDALTLTMDPARVEERITPRTRALLPVHLYGQCADMDPLVDIAARRGIAVVEDCAQAHGATYRGRPAGSIGDAAAFSFYPTKNLGALGDGGMVVTRDAEIAQRVRELRQYGERTRYESVRTGANSRLDEIQAAILRVKLPFLERWNARRREIAAAYQNALGGSGVRLPVEAAERTHVFHLYVVRAVDRDALRERLAARGVGTLVHYPLPVHAQPAYARLATAGLVESERACREVLSLPLHPDLTHDEVAHVIEAFMASAP